MNRTEFLKQQALSGANKCRRAPLPPFSAADEQGSIPERKALALKMLFDHMPVFIGPKELIVGTRTFFSPNPGNEDGHDPFGYGLSTRIPYLNEKDVELFGCDQSYHNRTHFTPDFGIILEKGIAGILADAEARLQDDSLNCVQRDFLSGLLIAYRGLSGLILRYADEARTLAQNAAIEDKSELEEIARVCQKISLAPPDTFHEAVQLLWFTHLGTIIESFEFVNYGRLDVLLGRFLKDTPLDEALEIIECLLLKMYDQTDLNTSYLGKYASQLVITLGGVLPNGESAVNDVTMLFLEAIDHIRLPDPEFNLRISSKNPPAFLDKAAELTISGCNFISYYHDDLFVESLCRAGIPPENAREYAFDLCQDINIPGKMDLWLLGNPGLAFLLMTMLKEKRDFSSFQALLDAFKARISDEIQHTVADFNEAEAQMELYASGQLDAYFDGVHNHGKPVSRSNNSPMAPLPLLSALYHGAIENALDVTFEPYPLKEKGIIFGTATEAINSLAAIKKAVYDESHFTLDEVVAACESNFSGERGRLIQSILWNCPKWGNDDAYADDIAQELLEFCLRLCHPYRTHHGGRVLAGIHQAHPVPTGAKLMATPDGRSCGAPVAVTLSPQNGTMRNGPTAALSSAAKINPMLVQWNYCVMVNYFASVFKGNQGAEIFKSLLKGYFAANGLQHQPNVLDVDELKRAQLNPEHYKDLIVRLWGVSAHFVDLPRELQDEMIARFSA